MGTISKFLKETTGLLNKAYTKAADANFMDNVVQFDEDPNHVASGEASIIFSGPPVFNKGGNINGKTFVDLLVPIGAVQGFQESETPNIQPFPEIGSRLKRMAVGMSSYQVSLSRVITFHSNLRNALYSWLPRVGGDDFAFRVKPGLTYTDDKTGDGHMITSESEIMRVPFGILLATMTAGGRVVTKEYFEKCYIQNVGKAVQAGSGLIQENVTLFVTRKVAAQGVNISELADAAVDNYTVKEGHW